MIRFSSNVCFARDRGAACLPAIAYISGHARPRGHAHRRLLRTLVSRRTSSPSAPSSSFSPEDSASASGRRNSPPNSATVSGRSSASDADGDGDRRRFRRRQLAARLTRGLAAIPKTPRGAVAFVAAFAMLSSLLSAEAGAIAVRHRS
jgi:hypothetical protein